MQKFTSALLLSLMLLSTGGYYLVFRLCQLHIQEENEERILQTTDLGKLTLFITPGETDHEICWTRHNKEFSYRGEMYDVVKIRFQGQKKYYYCLNDSKEKQLIDNYNRAHKTQKEPEKKLKQNFDYTFGKWRFAFRAYPVPAAAHTMQGSFIYQKLYIDTKYPPPKTRQLASLQTIPTGC